MAVADSALNWDDLRLLLAVGQEGTIAGAARFLKTSRATLHRRLDGLMELVGEKFWTRTPSGLKFTTVGEELLELAQRMSNDIDRSRRRVSGTSRDMAGPLSVTVFEAGFLLFAKAFASFIRNFPEIELTVTASNDVLSLERRECDVAIRAANAPGADLFGRRIGQLDFGVFGTKEMAGIENPHWILPGKGQRWWRVARKRSPDLRVALRTNTIQAMRESAALGVGLAMLPYPLGASDARLVAYGTEPVAGAEIDVWVLTHTDLRGSVSVRRLMAFLASEAVACLANPGQKAQAERPEAFEVERPEVFVRND